MSTLLQKYGAGILSFLVALLTAVQVLPTNPSLVDVLNIAILAASSFVMFIVPLLKGAWVGGLKVGVELAGALAIAFLPFALNTEWNQTTLALVIIALIKAGATQLGITIRSETPVAGGLVADPASVKPPESSHARVH